MEEATGFISSFSASFFIFKVAWIGALSTIYITFCVPTFVQRVTNLFRNSKYHQNIVEFIVLSLISTSQIPFVDNPKITFCFLFYWNLLLHCFHLFEAMNNCIYLICYILKSTLNINIHSAIKSITFLQNIYFMY